MNIDIQYDSSVSGAPAGFKTAVQAAVSYIDSVISTPITVTLAFGWGEVNGQTITNSAVGESSAQGELFDYSQVRSALSNAATSSDDFASIAALPSVDPTGGGQFFISSAQEKALGIPSSYPAVDGWVGLSSQVTFSFDPNHRAQSGAYDAVGILEHEISEDLGRTSGLGQTLSDGSHYYTPLDLFRYSTSGGLSPTAADGYFSVDGQHSLLPFNNPSNGGDAGDWADTVQNDSFTEAGNVGQQLNVSTTDLRVLDVLGYTLGDPHAPVSDFNGDGLSDLLWYNAASTQESVWRSDGHGFVGAGVQGAPSGWAPIGIGDFNGDGRADMLWFDGATNQVSVWDSNGSGFLGAGVAGAPTGWAPVGAGDFNGDGRADILWFDAATTQVSIWQSTGSGFQGAGVASAPSGWVPVGLGDFNADGKADVLWFDQATNQVSLWNSSPSGLQGAGVWGAPSGWTPVGVGDFNGDGKADILWFDASTNQVSIWLAENGGFVGTGVAGAPSGWTPIAVGDYNGDGKADIAWFNSASGQESTWMSSTAAWQSTSASLSGAGVQTAPSGWVPVDTFQTGPYGLHIA